MKLEDMYSVFAKAVPDSRTYNQVWCWCKQNCQGDFILYNAWQARFEKREDAMLFLLRWT